MNVFIDICISLSLICGWLVMVGLHYKVKDLEEKIKNIRCSHEHE